MLPDDDDEGILTRPEDIESPIRRPRAARGPADEFPNNLILIQRDIEYIVKEFPIVLPTKEAALALTKTLRKLYDLIERYHDLEGRRGRQKVLEEFGTTTMEAAIAARFLAEGEPSIKRMMEFFECLQKFRSKLDAVLRTYRSPGGR